MRLRLTALVAVPLAAACLAGCAGTVSLNPAPNAADPACADVIVRLPGTVAGLGIRHTDAQSTAAWGDPALVLLHCGVSVPGPTTEHCVTADGVDWIIDDPGSATPTYTTYGRDPAVAIQLDHTKVSDAAVLSDLKDAVTVIPQHRHCTAAGDAPPSG